MHRRRLHRIPELDRKLPETRRYVLDVLEKLDCEIVEVAEDGKGLISPEEQREYTGGICAFFDFGCEDAFAFRSDMDALPISEKNESEYSSIHQGMMHACGHDGHMAMLLSFAEYLDHAGDSVSPEKNVLLIFQPAEETTGGAPGICRSGVLEKYRVCGVFGFHLWPDLEAGTVSSIPGPMMAKTSEINIDIEGRSSHCTAASEGIDALYAGCRLMTEIYRIPEIGPGGSSILKFGKMTSGDVRNAISSHTRIEGTLRVHDLDTFDRIVQSMEDAAARTDEELSCRTSVFHSSGYPPVTNDDVLYRRACDALKAYGVIRYEELEKPSMIGEDFSFYQLKVPGVFFYLGTGTGIPLHADTFDFDESVLACGVLSYAVLSGTSEGIERD